MEQDCLDDALLLAIVEQAKQVRHTLHSLADDPEANWLDGYIAGWFKAYFHPSPLEIAENEEDVLSPFLV